MIRSMTGFGAGRGATAGEEIDVEVRSVNHKYCEVKVRLPRELASLEQEAVRVVKDCLARGGVDVSVRRTALGGSVAPQVDVALAESYARAFAEVQARLGLPGAVTLGDVLSAEGVIRLAERAVDVEGARSALATALGAALDALVAMRAREGEALARDLESRLGVVEASVARVAELSPRVVEQQRRRLAERIAELTGGVALDPARLVQEIALFADRTDVAEEITRLRSHVAQARVLLAGSDPAGRKLDFLVQEMHREVNTIGSKSQSAELASLVVGLKAEIERMREQVQNVE
ncbi:YicC/YloC family endoribonuclease [Anaeromyxobacter oryzisoli]|uniref:YicC/YloC family endoribonuclease n=1 Tax=Anaeromyxobacter oryzisoli TaxID=2925408 RepID=UPI001F5A71B2|nr:YicC/YloC family endoribonuclease [Anaeromyxobacter sp. SG63]